MSASFSFCLLSCSVGLAGRTDACGTSHRPRSSPLEETTRGEEENATLCDVDAPLPLGRA